MEVCVDSLESAIEAANGGAMRLELCSSLTCGGLTPSVGLLEAVKSRIKAPVFVMLRPRGGDFIYSKCELEIMKSDAQLLRDRGADGFVFGALLEDGRIDSRSCEELATICKPLPMTFHRAIDASKHPIENIPTLISIGFNRILTSGGKASALDGCPILQEMITKYGNQIVIMPGGGITKYNLREILQVSGAKEFHGSASVEKISKMSFINPHVTLGSSNDYVRKICDKDLVHSMVAIHANFTINKT